MLEALETGSGSHYYNEIGYSTLILWKTEKTYIYN